MATTPDHDLLQSEHLLRTPRGRIGLIVAGSLAAGLVAALALVAAPFIPAKEGVLTGVVLLGFAFGWALLAVLSVQFSDQPQRWAAAPAVFFALAGLISLLPSGSVVQKVFGWVWPPLLLGLVVWMFVRAHRQLRSRTRRWLVYPLLLVLGLASIGGGYETVRESIDATRLPSARPAHRCGRAPAAPELHRLRQPHSRAGARPGRGLPGDGVDRAGRRA